MDYKGCCSQMVTLLSCNQQFAALSLTTKVSSVNFRLVNLHLLLGVVALFGCSQWVALFCRLLVVKV